jgi:hypothetical protein
MKKLSIIALVLLAGTSALALQRTANSVRGRFIDDVTGQAVPRVRMTVTAGELVDPLVRISDIQTNVLIPDLPSGRYRLSLEKAGYFTEQVDLPVGSAPETSLGDIVLTAKREISGTIRWQDGEPASGAQIRLFRIRGGKPVNANDIPGTSTNPRGEFVVSNLRPGRYILLVTPPATTAGVDFSGRSVPGGKARAALPVFYPGVTIPDVRSTLDLRRTVSVPNVQVVLEERGGGLVEGTILPSSAIPQGSIVPVSLSVAGLFSLSTVARAGVPFSLGPVPAGSYILDAQSQGPNASRTFLRLTVGNAPLLGITVVMPPPSELTGKVEIDDPARPLSAGVSIQSEKVPGTLVTQVSPTGDFRIPLVVAGETYGMTITGYPTNAYIATVSQAGQDLPYSPFSVTTGEPVRIVLKTDGGTIEGKVKANDRAASQAFVVLAPKDRRAEQSFRTTTADREGVFKLPAISPGDYDLLAFERNDDFEYLDEMFLQRFADRAVQIQIQPRASRTVDLTVVE